MHIKIFLHRFYVYVARSGFKISNIYSNNENRLKNLCVIITFFFRCIVCTAKCVERNVCEAKNGRRAQQAALSSATS